MPTTWLIDASTTPVASRRPGESLGLPAGCAAAEVAGANLDVLPAEFSGTFLITVRRTNVATGYQVNAGGVG